MKFDLDLTFFVNTTATILASLSALVQHWETEGVWPPTPPGPIQVNVDQRGPAAAYLVAIARLYDAPCAAALAPLIQPLPVLLLRSPETATDAIIATTLAEYLASSDAGGRVVDAAALEEALLTNRRWRLLAHHAQMWPCHRLGPALYVTGSLPSSAVDLLLPVLPPWRCLRLASLPRLYLSSSPCLQLLLLRAPPSLLRSSLALRTRLVWLVARARFEADTAKTVSMDEVAMWDRLIKHAWQSISVKESCSPPRWTFSNPYFISSSTKPFSGATTDEPVQWERVGPSAMLWAVWEAAAPPLSPLYYTRLSSALLTVADTPNVLPTAVLCALSQQAPPSPGAAALADWLTATIVAPTSTSLAPLLPDAAQSLSAAQQLLHWLPIHALLPAATDEHASASLQALMQLWNAAPHWSASSLRSYWLRVLSSALPSILPLLHSAAASCTFLVSLIPALESVIKTEAPLGVVAALATKRLQSACALTSPPIAVAPQPPPSPTTRLPPLGDWESDATAARAFRRIAPAANASTVPSPPPTVLPTAPLLFSLQKPSIQVPRKAVAVEPSILPLVASSATETPAPTPPEVPMFTPSPTTVNSSIVAPQTPPQRTISPVKPRSPLPLSQSSLSFPSSPMAAAAPPLPSPPSRITSTPTKSLSPFLRSSPAASASSPPALSARRSFLPLTPLKRPQADEANEREEDDEQNEVLLL